MIFACGVAPFSVWDFIIKLVIWVFVFWSYICRIIPHTLHTKQYTLSKEIKHCELFYCIICINQYMYIYIKCYNFYLNLRICVSCEWLINRWSCKNKLKLNVLLFNVNLKPRTKKFLCILINYSHLCRRDIAWEKNHSNKLKL